MPYVWCFLSAVLIMTICSRSSFLYVFNLWDDANSYFTVGKCIFRGFVPYRDLFDQKGIMLYFIYGLASLISPTTFFGVYLMEIIAAYFSLRAIFRISQLFLGSRQMPYVVTSLSGAVIYSSRNFYWGGSAEEFLFPFIMWGLYLSARYFRKEYPHPCGYGTVLLGGVLAGCVLNIKFNSLGFYFAFMMMIFFADIIGDVQIEKAFKSCLVFLGGMGLATLPWIIYFAVNRSLYSWVYVYIYKNVFEYSKKITIGERAYLFYDILKNHFLNNTLVFVFILIGIVYFTASCVTYLIRGEKTAVTIKLGLFELINLGMMLLFLVLVIFIGGVSLPYYSFPINAFVVFGFIPFCYIIEKLINKTVRFVLCPVALVAGACLIWFLSMNVKTMGVTADGLWLYKFRDHIKASGVQDPGLIVEFTFDVGLYTVLDIEPICYYFQTQTLNMDEVLEYQKRYLHSGEADFIVTCDTPAEGERDLYDKVMTERCVFYDFDHTYYLYQRNDNPVTE